MMLSTRHGDVYFEYKNGFFTIAHLTLKTGETVLGSAVCAKEDRFQRRVGRKVALTRAMKALPREVRREVWEDLWQQGVGK